MKAIYHFETFPRGCREPADGAASADRVADHVIETLEHLNQLARATGQADMAEILDQAFHRCLTAHVAAKAAQLSARIDADRAGGNPSPFNLI
jgi:hypothetical protein